MRPHHRRLSVRVLSALIVAISALCYGTGPAKAVVSAGLGFQAPQIAVLGTCSQASPTLFVSLILTQADTDDGLGIDHFTYYLVDGDGKVLGVQQTLNLIGAVGFAGTGVLSVDSDPGNGPFRFVLYEDTDSTPEFAVGASATLLPGLVRAELSFDASLLDPNCPGSAQQSDISISLGADVEQIGPGGTLTYTATVSNAGPSIATNVVASFTLPASLTLTATAGCANDPNGVPICNLGDIASGTNTSFDVQASVNTGSSGTISASVAVASGVVDPDPGDNTASDDTTVIPPQADLSATLGGDVEQIAAGGTLILTATVSNAGPDTATNAIAIFTLPTGVTLSATTGCTNDPNGVPICNLGDITSGGSTAVDVEVTVDLGVTGTLTATVLVASDLSDPVPSDNSASDDTTVGTAQADLSVSLGGDVEQIAAGGTLTLTATVANAGPSTATNVTAIVTLPAGLTLVATTGCGNDPNGAPVCSLADIAPGSNSAFDVQATVNLGVTGTLTASVLVSSDLSDPDPTNNSASDGTAVGAPLADLSVSLDGDVELIAAGGSFTYTASVNNAGPNDATNVVAIITLPGGLAFSASSGCVNDPNGAPICNLGTIGSGGGASVDIEVIVNPGASGTVSASVLIASDATDPDPTDNLVSDDTTIGTPLADLSVTLDGDVQQVAPGGSFTYTATVSNAGPSTATNAVAIVTLPVGLSLTLTTGCSNDPNGAPICQLGNIVSGASTSFDVQVSVGLGVGGTVATAVLVASDIIDPDPTDNVANDDTSVGSSQADISVSLVGDLDQVSPGGAFTYTAMVSNAGPATAPNVVATVTLPGGLTATTTSGCANDPNGVPICNLGDIVSGGTASFDVDVSVDSAASGSLSASVAVTSDAIDVDPTDNIAIDATTISVTAGTVSIIVRTVPSTAGNDTFTFTSDIALLDGAALITVNNVAVSISAPVPAGLYEIIQNPTGDWVVDTITCSGDDDGGSLVNLPNRSVNLDLDSDESIVCVFVNVRQGNNVVSATLGVISDFMKSRADGLTSQKPDLSTRANIRRLARLDGNPLEFTATGTPDNLSMSFASSAQRIIAAADALNAPAVRDVQEALSYVPDLRGPVGAERARPGRTHRFDVWTEGRYSHLKSGSTESDFLVFYLGADYRINETVLIGLLAQTDWTSGRDDNAGSAASGFGWMVGPYAAVKAHENVTVSGRFSWGQSHNNVDPFGFYEDEFETDRWLVEGRVTGNFNHGNWGIRPGVEVVYYEEEQKAYVDSLGNPIPSQTVQLGRMTFGPELRHQIKTPDGTVVTPHLVLEGVWDFFQSPEDTDPNATDIRARVEFGMTINTVIGWSVNMAAIYDGIGANSFESYGGELGLVIPFD